MLAGSPLRTVPLVRESQTSTLSLPSLKLAARVADERLRYAPEHGSTVVVVVVDVGAAVVVAGRVVAAGVVDAAVDTLQ